ncbi:Glutaredoxin-C9 protein [Spatholobus suberectus]|nr:Glutaredoxin-C9 protein [Spatholobus suberectus]
MQQAIPYRTWRPLITPTATPTTHFTISPHSLTTHIHNTVNTHNSNSNNNNNNSPSFDSHKMVLKMVLENAVIVFARRGDCFWVLGVNPAVHEVEEKDEVRVVRELEAIVGANVNDGTKMQFPAVFIGGKLFGGLDRVMGTHISGELVPILKEAGALWL